MASKKIHKRVHLEQSTDILVSTLASLTNVSYQEAMEAALLFGVAYINQKNKLDLMKWVDRIELPTLENVENFYKGVDKV